MALARGIRHVQRYCKADIVEEDSAPRSGREEEMPLVSLALGIECEIPPASCRVPSALHAGWRWPRTQPQGSPAFLLLRCPTHPLKGNLHRSCHLLTHSRGRRESAHHPVGSSGQAKQVHTEDKLFLFFLNKVSLGGRGLLERRVRSRQKPRTRGPGTGCRCHRALPVPSALPVNNQEVSHRIKTRPLLTC